MSPAMKAGYVLFALGLVMGIVSLVMRFSRKRATTNTGNAVAPGEVPDRTKIPGSRTAEQPASVVRHKQGEREA
jgi:hypothetical protein